MTSHSPVVIFAYNRPNHLRDTLESLKNCELASETRLFIFCDGAPVGSSSSNLSQIQEVRKITSDVEGFASVEVVYSDTNLGLFVSIVSGVSKVFEVSDRIIVLEDDLILDQKFLKFMNASLNAHVKNSEVMSVSGYCYPLPFSRFRRHSFFLKAFSCLGWGTWRDRWSQVAFNDRDLYRKIMKSPSNRFRFNMFGTTEYTKILEQSFSPQKKGSWAIQVWLNQFLNNTLQVFPSHNLVYHAGYDGSGTNCIALSPWIDRPLESVLEVDLEPRRPRYSGLQQLNLVLFFFKSRVLMFLKLRVLPAFGGVRESI